MINRCFIDQLRTEFGRLIRNRRTKRWGAALNRPHTRAPRSRSERFGRIVAALVALVTGGAGAAYYVAAAQGHQCWYLLVVAGLVSAGSVIVAGVCVLST